MTRLQTLWLCLIAALAVMNTAPAVLAQTTPPWQAANTIRQSLLAAQTEMFAAARADDPAAHRQSAAAHIDDAAAHYQAALRPQLAVSAAPAAIEQALADARAAVLAGNAAALSAARGRAWTGILWASYESVLAALKKGDPGAAADWLQLREYRPATRVSVAEDASTRAVAALARGAITPAEAQATIGAVLRDAYFFRLRDALNQLDAALENKLPTRAADWAGQAQGYARILSDDLARRLGDSPAEQLAGALANLEQATLAGDWAAAAAHSQAARAALSGYQPVDLDTAAVAQRAQLLHLFTDLIYVEYKAGVRAGQVVIPIEYQEAVTFRNQAEAVFEELRPHMAAANGPAAERFALLLAEMETILTELGDDTALKTRVDEALGLVEQTLAVNPAAANSSESALLVINTLFDDIVRGVAAGRYQAAERSRLEAYATFENGIEQRLANRAVVLSRELEGLFWEGSGGQKGLATLLQEQATPAEIEASTTLLRAKLAEAQNLLTAGLTGWLAAANSLAIIIREGLEAVLIIGAILGYLRATNAPAKYSAWVYAGIAAAVALSLLTWVVASRMIAISVASRELLEGVTSLIAVAVLFYVTNWLFHKVYVIDWLVFVKEQVGKALGSGSALALAGLGFTVVYREGFETVLFYQALLFDAEAGWVLLGFGLGLIIILAVAYAILRLSMRLPLKPFFTGTGLLLVLAFSLTGKGVRELQEAGVIAVSLLPWLPENLLLMELLGLFPTVETTLAQAGLVAGLAATFAISRWQRRPGPASPAAVAKGENA